MLNTIIAANTSTIPQIATGPIVSPIIKNPNNVAAAGSTVASTAALPAEVLLRPRVYRRNGMTAVTTDVRSTKQRSPGMLSVLEILTTRSTGFATKMEPRPAVRKVYVVTV